MQLRNWSGITGRCRKGDFQRETEVELLFRACRPRRPLLLDEEKFCFCGSGATPLGRVIS